ncbi:PmoA family protein [Planctomycetota bacterium]
MNRQISRRQLLTSAVAAPVAIAFSHGGMDTAFAVDHAEPVPDSKGLTVYQNGANILIRLDNLPVLGYRAHPTLKYPYFCPLNGPVSGASLSSESALPYPHHRGLWLGCDPVNGGNYWADNDLATGQIRSVELALDPDATTESSVTFTEKCHWVREGGGTPFRDERRYVVSVAGEPIRLIDCDFTLIAHEPIEIKRAKHSFFAMRAAPDISPSYGGVLMNSEGGVGAEGTYGKQATWCGFHGKRAFRPEVVEGIAIMDHPGNFGGNCPWFTRDYGHLSPSPFNFLDKPWRMEEGEILELKYRVVLHAGTPQQAGLDTIYDQWITR